MKIEEFSQRRIAKEFVNLSNIAQTGKNLKIFVKLSRIMKTIAKRIIKVVLFALYMPMWILWNVIWFATMAVNIFIIAPIAYIITGKDLLGWWCDQIGLIQNIAYKIEKEIDRL